MSIKLFIKDVLTMLSHSRKKVLLVVENMSGSNTFALWKYINSNPLEIDAEVEVFYKFLAKSKVKLYNYILKYGYITVYTHGYIIKPRNGIYIDLWHGIPLKAMGKMDNGLDLKGKKLYHKSFMRIDYIMSYSDFYTVLLNACSGVNVEKYIITGAPRNDLLLSSDGRNNLEKLLGIDLKSYDGIIFMLPTFRIGYLNRIEGESIIYDILRNLDNFDSFLQYNNIAAVLKLHPFEEKFLYNMVSKKPVSNLFILENKTLEENGIDLYEALNAADILITDYSSVYFDYLLLNRPIIFYPKDIAKYKKIRGFLLEPYDMWTPGPKVYNLRELQKEILKSINNPNYYAEERERLKNIVHYYQDANSSKRVWEFIKSLLER